MRNLLLFILFLLGLFFVRRALRRTLGGLGGRKEDVGGGGARQGAEAPREVLEAEQMVACAHCGLHVPESEGVRGNGAFFCSSEHRRLGVRP
ncbi:MAG: PP0621 family protein [Zoogloea sp.]|uniref:PP0621 family protein n=1 Tax=Zoogloea sp. TaxID=49181 RepID=UPI00261644AF|nr:PP0621 family protein [Zoogloea sp.]MDD2989924.1 PP0621 family protein [Zoogloea sp.]